MENQTTTLTVTTAADTLAAELAPTLKQLETIRTNYANVTALDFSVAKNRTTLSDADKELKKLKTAVNKNLETFKAFTKDLTKELTDRCDALIAAIELIRKPIEEKRTEVEAEAKQAAAAAKAKAAAEALERERFIYRAESLYDAGFLFDGKVYTHRSNDTVLTPDQLKQMSDNEFRLIIDVATVTVEAEPETPQPNPTPPTPIPTAPIPEPVPPVPPTNAGAFPPITCHAEYKRALADCVAIINAVEYKTRGELVAKIKALCEE